MDQLHDCSKHLLIAMYIADSYHKDKTCIPASISLFFLMNIIKLEDIKWCRITVLKHCNYFQFLIKFQIIFNCILSANVGIFDPTF